jgi:hypothetical protein
VVVVAVSARLMTKLALYTTTRPVIVSTAASARMA